MKRKHKVLWSDVAEKDLIGIIEYIAADSTTNALKVFQKNKAAASRLHSSPYHGRIVPELKQFGLLQYRELIITPWRVVYRASQTSVYVLSVIDARRNVEDILLDRLIKQKI